MIPSFKMAGGRLTGVFGAHCHQHGVLHGHLKVLTAGLKTHEVPPDFSDVVLPDRPKLTFLDKVPNLVKAVKEMKKLNDIRGPEDSANAFTTGKFAIMAQGGGYLRWGHMEMMRLSLNRKMNPTTTFAKWRIVAPYKPLTRKGLGQRMGGGKGAIDHYVTPVKCGAFILEVGGKVEFAEVETILLQMAKKLPFLAKVVTRESHAEMLKLQEEMENNNQNPWTFKDVVQGNMLGIRKFTNAFDLKHHGRYSGSFLNKGRV